MRLHYVVLNQFLVSALVNDLPRNEDLFELKSSDSVDYLDREEGAFGVGVIRSMLDEGQQK
jgi:hypothetical protein